MESSVSETPWPLRARSLLSEREKTLYRDLISLYPDHKLFVQVALSQLLDVAQGQPDRFAIRGRFKQLVSDFVLCRSDLTVVAVIELDDRTHFRADRKRADDRKTKALAGAGLRLVRIPAGPIPPLGKLKALIEETAAPKVSGTRTENVLKLVDTVPTWPAGSHSQFAGAFGAGISRRTKRAVLRVVVTIIFALVGWFAYATFLPSMLKQAFASLDPTSLKAHVATAPVAIPRGTPNITDVSEHLKAVTESAAERPADRATLVELQRQKMIAWAAFYSAPSTCDSPPSWKDQVECGNQYIRARRLFEKQWVATHPTDQAPGPAILDNAAIKQLRSGPQSP